jgi:hypothetical protein
MKEVMKNIRASLTHFPFEAAMIYRNPKCHAEVLASGLFRKMAEFPAEQDFRFFVYHGMNWAENGTAGGHT